MRLNLSPSLTSDASIPSRVFSRWATSKLTPGVSAINSLQSRPVSVTKSMSGIKEDLQLLASQFQKAAQLDFISMHHEPFPNALLASCNLSREIPIPTSQLPLNKYQMYQTYSGSRSGSSSLQPLGGFTGCPTGGVFTRFQTIFLAASLGRGRFASHSSV